MDFKIVNPIPDEDLNYISYLLYNDLLERTLDYIGSGCFGDVYRYKDYAIKIFKDYSNNSDGPILEKLQDIQIFPKLYFYNDKLIVTKFYPHTAAYDYFERNVDIDYTPEDIFKLCFDRGLIPHDIHDENVVVTNNDEFKFIDVGNFRDINVVGEFHKVLSDKSSIFEIKELAKIIEHIRRPSIAI